jgi:plastocyanin
MRRQFLLSIASLPFLLVLGIVAAGAASAGGGCHGGTGATASTASSTVVRIDGCTFQPTVNQVPVGVLVTFLNTSGGPHDVTGGSGGWRSPMLDGGASYTHRFTESGVYPYSCSLHPGMAGVVVVGPSDIALASDVQVAPVAVPAAPTDSGSPVPVVVAAGAGLLAGALGAGLLLRRREQADQG